MKFNIRSTEHETNPSFKLPMFKIVFGLDIEILNLFRILDLDIKYDYKYKQFA